MRQVATFSNTKGSLYKPYLQILRHQSVRKESETVDIIPSANQSTVIRTHYHIPYLREKVLKLNSRTRSQMVIKCFRDEAGKIL